MSISIRGGSQVKISPPAEVIIDHTNDSIRLGDGTNFFTSTTKGDQIGLDVSGIPYTNAFDITNLAIATANTEVAQAIPSDTRSFFVKIRKGASVFRIAFTAGATATTFIEFGRGQHWLTPDFDGDVISTVYIRTEKAPVTAEFMFFKCS